MPFSYALLGRRRPTRRSRMDATARPAASFDLGPEKRGRPCVGPWLLWTSACSYPQSRHRTTSALEVHRPVGRPSWLPSRGLRRRAGQGRAPLSCGAGRCRRPRRPAVRSAVAAGAYLSISAVSFCLRSGRTLYHLDLTSSFPVLFSPLRRGCLFVLSVLLFITSVGGTGPGDSPSRRVGRIRFAVPKYCRRSDLPTWSAQLLSAVSAFASSRRRRDSTMYAPPARASRSSRGRPNHSNPRRLR